MECHWVSAQGAPLKLCDMGAAENLRSECRSNSDDRAILEFHQTLRLPADAQSAPYQSPAGSAAAAPPGETAAAAANSPAAAPNGTTLQPSPRHSSIRRQRRVAPRDVEIFAGMNAAEVEHKVQCRAMAEGLLRGRERAHNGKTNAAEQVARSGAGCRELSAGERRERRRTVREGIARRMDAGAGAQAPDRRAEGVRFAGLGDAAAAAPAGGAPEDPARPLGEVAATAPAVAPTRSEALAGGRAAGAGAGHGRRSVGGRGSARSGAARRAALPALPACAEAADEGDPAAAEGIQRPAATPLSPTPPGASRAETAGPAHEPASGEQAGQGTPAADAERNACAPAPAPATEPKQAAGPRADAGARRRTMAPRGGAAKARADGEENRPPGPRSLNPTACVAQCMRSGLQVYIRCQGILRPRFQRHFLLKVARMLQSFGHV